jgi:hypothetical protein
MVQGRQAQPGVTDQGIAHRIASSDDVGVDVELHHVNGTGFGQAPFFGNHGTAGTADEKYQVRIADQIVAVGKAPVAADHAESIGMIFGNGALSADRGGHGTAQQFGKFLQLIPRFGPDNTCPGHNQRLSGLEQRLHRLVDRPGVGCLPHGRIAAIAAVNEDILIGDLIRLGVQCQSDVAGAHGPGDRRLEGLPKGPGQFRTSIGGVGVDGQGLEKGILVHLRQCSPPAVGGIDIRCQAEQGDRRLVGFRYGRNDIGHPTAAGPFAYPYFAAQPCVGIRHVACRPFIPRENVLDGGLEVIKCLVVRKAGIPAQSKHHFHTRVFQ